MPNLGPLNNDQVVVIIGGGPAGSSCAIKLKKLAAKNNSSPRIIIYEGKRFEKKSYYNQCLGVLSPPLNEIITGQLDLPFPWDIVQRRINGYYVHSEKNKIKLSGEQSPSYACRRVEFDNYLFQQAKNLGVETIPARVTELDIYSEGIMVFSESNNIRADVVVGAFGLDDGMAKIFERLTPYRQPKFLSSVVTKIHPDESCMRQFGNYLFAFLPASLPKIEFGAITPKGNHLTVNIAGHKVNAQMMDRFLKLPTVMQALPCPDDPSRSQLFYFKGKFPTLPAKGIFGDRYVMIGDAAGLNRPFKGKGINSAVITGIRAAETIIQTGISKQAFGSYQKNCCDLTDDIPYGKSLRLLSGWTKRLGLLDSVIETAKEEAGLRKALFNIVSGQESYKTTWREEGGWIFLLKIGFKSLFHKIFKT